MTPSTSAKSCPRCGSPIQAGAEGLCAACLMLRAMENEGDAEAETLPPVERPGGTGSLAESSEFPLEFGGYRLLRLLGSGGMGTVYEAEQRSTGRRIALKMLSQRIESPDMRGRFQREGRLAAGISHPNSLYVFGTEEIEGIPVITMEIAASGTLADRLEKRGPLRVSDAVDAVLGLIAGLEAAHAAGVLHRDVKPSNVFLNPDGTVKVGDYGLSVSTIATVESFATATGVALGTPAYAAPEQLRGDQLDVRADIYSVGATLFTLLTDRAPIEGDNPVQIVAAALDEKPKALTTLRSDVPPRLAQVVARCLAKRPQQRYANYMELRSALLPFSSETPQAASPAKRGMAYFVDEMLSWFIPTTAVATYYGVGSLVELPIAQQFWAGLLLAVWYISYYTLPEGSRGAGLGKGGAGIRVARGDGRPPGFARAFLRAAIAWFARQGGGVFFVLAGLGFFAKCSFLTNSILFIGFSIGLMLLPLVTMRRRNGFAVFWDLVTQTRVVQPPEALTHPVIGAKSVVGENVEKQASLSELIGPYAVIEETLPGWIAGLDPALDRGVWLRKRDTRDVAETRRNLARPARSRWLQSVEKDETTWDVFEAPPGVPLSELVFRDSRLHWDAIRHWLYELTIELAQASEDGTLPQELTLDHVWITESGRAMLLDEPWPRTNGSAKPDSAASPASGSGDVNFDPIEVCDVAGRQRFINTIAQCVDPTTVPLHARPVLRNLATSSFDKLSFLAGAFVRA